MCREKELLCKKEKWLVPSYKVDAETLRESKQPRALIDNRDEVPK